MARKLIKKVSVAPVDPITGSIVDGTNIDDKSRNTYSANILDGVTLYEGTEFVTTGTLSDSIINYKRIKIYAKSADNFNIDRELLTSEMADNGNLVTTLWTGNVNNGTGYMQSSAVRLNDKTFTLVGMNAVTLKNNANATITENANNYKIVKIVGYKF